MKKIINLKNKFNKFDDYWSPKIIASFNDQEIKLVKNFINYHKPLSLILKIS